MFLCVCVDVNECEREEDNMCSDVCINDDGGYSCQCPSGKTLSKNDLQCGGMASYYHIAPYF